MPKKSKTLCVDDLRHAEYYGMQDTFDELYQKSQNGEVFENLMDLILSRDNILLAYRNIKANKGSYTAGTDKKNITDSPQATIDDVPNYYLTTLYLAELKERNAQLPKLKLQMSRFNDDF